MEQKIYRTDSNGKRMPGRPRVIKTIEPVAERATRIIPEAQKDTPPVAGKRFEKNIDDKLVVTGTIVNVPDGTQKAYSERNIDMGSFSFLNDPCLNTIDPDSLEKIYKQNEIASACVDVTSFAVAGAGFHFQKYLTEEDLNENHRILLQRMFDDINDDDDSDSLFVETSMDLLTFGDAYWERVVNYKLLPDFVKYLKNPKPDPWGVEIPYRFYKVSPKLMKPILNEARTQIIGWRQTDVAGKTLASWNQFEIVHFRMPSPIDQVNGVPPAGTLGDNIAADIFASDYNGKFFQNNATPRLHIDLGNVSQTEMDKFIGNCEAKLKGQPHKNLVTRGGVTVNSIGIKNADMEFGDYQERLGQKTMAKFRVPPMILGFLKSTSSMSAESQINLFKFLAVSPIRKILAGRINKMIIRKCFVGVKAQFAFNPVDRLDALQQSTIDSNDVKANIRTINEVRADRGLGSVDYGNDPILMPGQNAPGEAPGDPQPASKGPAKPKKGKQNGGKEE